jgi:hypothetical protein
MKYVIFNTCLIWATSVYFGYCIIKNMKNGGVKKGG